MMKNIIEIFQKNVKKTPNKPAVIFEGIEYSYKTLESDIKQFSLYFESLGITKNTHVILLLDNSYGYIVSMLSLANLGAVLVPLSTSTKKNTLDKAIASSDTTHIISQQTLDQIPNKVDASNYTLGKNQISAKEDFILTMTSGSTGDPKPIVFTQETKIKRSLLGAKDLYDLSSDEVIIVASPLYHSLGQRLVLLPLLIGGTCVLLKKFNPKNWIDAAIKHKVTFTIAIASHLELLVDSIANEDNLSSLRTLVSSSSLLHTDTKIKCIEKFQCNFHECYGASEVGIVTNLSPQDAKRCVKSVGKALEFVDLKIVDEDKNEVSHGVTGEIICKSQTAFSRYYNNKLQTKKSVIDGYFYTGDLGFVDQEGYLYLSGRKKDMIIVGGTNVYPTDIEDVILQVSCVKECSVIGVEDSYFGEAILAVLVVDEIDFNLKDVKVACVQNLNDYQQPMAFEIVSQLPKNDLGKVMKHKLKEMFQDYDATKSLRTLLQGKG